ncbi:MAG: hypothetical protein ABI867_18695 [Kofleriaceae bacterium]
MKTLGILGFALVAGCSGMDEPTGPETLPDLVVPPVPENGIQVITPIVRDLQPAMDYEICSWTDVILDRQVDIKSTIGYQTEPPGHHVILFYTLDKQPPGTSRVCTDTDMASFRYLTGNGANGVENPAPGNLVFRLPEGAQLVVNHHYLNATDQVLEGQALINVNFAEPGGTYTPSGALAIVDTAIEVPVGESSHDIHCTMQRDLKLWYLIPHMHRWGREITVDVTHAGLKTRMFDTIWEESFTFYPPEIREDPTTPLRLSAGDQIDVHCDWNNDTDRTLNFGFEMCVSFGQFVDDEGLGNVACDGGNWTDF